jgi:superfamily II DNA or RNA helicase
MANYPDIRTAVNALLHACDGAMRRDDRGFNKFDASFMRDIINHDFWTPKQAYAVWKGLKKYRGQLIENHGIDFNTIDEPKPDDIENTPKKSTSSVPPKPILKADLNLDEFVASIPWSPGKNIMTKDGVPMLLKSANLPKNFWDVWNGYKDTLKEKGISISKYTGDWKVNWWIEQEKEEKNLVKIEDIELKYADTLLEYQIPHVKQLIASLKNYNAALDSSDTGTGKTYTGCCVAKELDLIPIVVTPKSVIPSFKRVMIEHFGIKNGFVINYEQFKIGNTPYLKVEKEEKMVRGKMQEIITFTWNMPDNAVVIFDEVHRCKNYKTQNSKMLVSAKQQGVKIIAMSATIGCNPLQMYAIGYTLELFKTKSQYFRWIRLHGCREAPFGGFEFDGNKEHLVKIHKKIYPHRGSRISIKELGDLFPETLIMADTYNMNGVGEKIDKIYHEMRVQLFNLAEKKMNDKESHLTIMLRARQKMELLKVPTFVELAQDHIEEGNSVAIFVNFDETLLAISKKLKSDCIIWGKNKKTATFDERQTNIDRFNNEESHEIICNIRSGGVGISLHDIHGERPRVSLISPSWSAEDVLQALGRIHRAGGKSKSVQKLVFCADSIEESICYNVNQKISNIQSLNDGDMDGGIL